MIDRRNCKILLDELEILANCIEPYQDSLIDLLPHLFDEIQESIPDDLFVQTTELIEECRHLVAEYKRKGEATWLKKTECWFNGKIVGERFYEKDGTLVTAVRL